MHADINLQKLTIKIIVKIHVIYIKKLIYQILSQL